MRKSRLIATLVPFVVLAGIPATGLADSPGLLDVTEDVTLGDDWYGSVVVAAPGVTLNCAGHSIIGPGVMIGEGDEVEELGGISVEPATGGEFPDAVVDVTIKNCNIVNHIGGVAVGADRTNLIGNSVVHQIEVCQVPGESRKRVGRVSRVKSRHRHPHFIRTEGAVVN